MRQGSSVADRGQRLFTVSAIAPTTILLVVAVVSVLHLRTGPGRSGSLVFVIVCGMVVAVIAAWSMYWGYRHKPDYWSIMSTWVGILVTFLASLPLFGTPEDERYGLGTATYSVLSVLILLGMLTLSWLPARQGARVVLHDPPAAADSPLTFRFLSRVLRNDVFCVTPDSLDLERHDKMYRAEWSYPLTDVTGVAVGNCKHESTYPMPGLANRMIKVRPGEVVIVRLPNGKLVFPARDTREMARLIAGRRALVRADHEPEQTQTDRFREPR